MAKVQTIDFKAFMKGEIKPLHQTNRNGVLLVSTAWGLFMVTAPQLASAQAETGTKSGGFDVAYDKLLEIVDWGALVCFVISGANFMLGNRTKAVEMLMGTTIGFIIVRHAKDMRDFVAGI